MTLEVCDRCGKEIKGTKATFSIDLTNPSFCGYREFKYKELCINCANKIRSMLDDAMDVFMEVTKDEEDE